MLAASVRGAPREVAADFGVAEGPHPASPLLCVGAGRANEGLRADWQQQLDTVQREIGFSYLRMHGLLHDDMGVYREKRDGTPVYDFQYIDALYDALLARHIRPFVELGFMPSALASGDKTIFWWRGNVTPPKDMAKWSGLIHALIRHWKDRYGAEEISRWYYEVWNEPDLSGFFSGTQAQYFDLYRATVAAIKAECPGCRVGGPASAIPFDYEIAFERYCVAEHLPADFVSTHCYGVEKGFLDETGTAGTRLSANPLAVADRMRHSRALLDGSGLKGAELHFTEWSSAYTPTDPVHDQYLQAAFILEQVRGAAHAVNSMSYWTFTDIFEEGGPPTRPFHGGFGLINLQGIRKSAFFAFRYLARLGDTDLRCADQESWITKSRSGKVAALLWHYVPAVPPAGENDQTFFRRELPAGPEAATSLRVSGLPAGRYRLQVFRTGYRRNDPYTAYLRMGAPDALTRDQVAKLQHEAQDLPIESRTVEAPGGVFSADFPLRSNDVCLVTLEPERL